MAEWFHKQGCGCPECTHEKQRTARNEREVGLYDKYQVERVDGSSRPGAKHHGCQYFVLDWAHDPFAIPAARAYADACESTYPELAASLRQHIAVFELRRIMGLTKPGK
jgi:hypothetical protein